MSLTTLRQSVRRKIGIGDTDTVVSDGNIDEAINDALQAIATERDWPWLYQEVSGTVATTGLLPLPADFSRNIFLTVRGQPVTPQGALDMAQYRTTTTGTAITGVPTSYTQAGSNLRLLPAPGSGTAYPYILGYLRTEPLLVNGGDNPLLPVAFQPWLVTRAALNIAIRTNDVQRQTTLQSEDVEWEKRVSDNVRRSEALPRIRRTRDSVWQDV